MAAYHRMRNRGSNYRHNSSCTCAFPLPSCMAGFLGATACGLGKEFGDSRAHGNTWSWPDIAADMIGAAVGCLVGFVALLI